jgi:hypothetical protein
MILFLIFTLDLLLVPENDLKTCSAILICGTFSKSHKIHFGATSNPSFPTLDSHFLSGKSQHAPLPPIVWYP